MIKKDRSIEKKVIKGKEWKEDKIEVKKKHHISSRDQGGTYRMCNQKETRKKDRKKP